MDLAGSTWELVSFETDTGSIPALPNAPAILSFSAGDGSSADNGRVSGSGGCNRYTGSYTVSGDRLTLGPLASTRMMCADTAMEQEQRYLTALQAVQRVERAGEKLIIAHPGGSLRFKAST